MEPKKKKQKVWAYSPHHSYKINSDYQIDGKDYMVSISMTSQLYKIGVHTILNNDPILQASTTPKGMVRAEKILKKQEFDGKVIDLVFSSPIRVTKDEDGFFIQIKDVEK